MEPSGKEQRDLEALAEYRKHKLCDCPACEAAREILKRQDAKSWPKPS